MGEKFVFGTHQRNTTRKCKENRIFTNRNSLTKKILCLLLGLIPLNNISPGYFTSLIQTFSVFLWYCSLQIFHEVFVHNIFVYLLFVIAPYTFRKLPTNTTTTKIRKKNFLFLTQSLSLLLVVVGLPRSSKKKVLFCFSFFF